MRMARVIIVAMVLVGHSASFGRVVGLTYGSYHIKKELSEKESQPSEIWIGVILLPWDLCKDVLRLLNDPLPEWGELSEPQVIARHLAAKFPKTKDIQPDTMMVLWLTRDRLWLTCDKVFRRLPYKVRGICLSEFIYSKKNPLASRIEYLSQKKQTEVDLWLSDYPYVKIITKDLGARSPAFYFAKFDGMQEPIMAANMNNISSPFRIVKGIKNIPQMTNVVEMECFYGRYGKIWLRYHPLYGVTVAVDDYEKELEGGVHGYVVVNKLISGYDSQCEIPIKDLTRINFIPFEPVSMEQPWHSNYGIVICGGIVFASLIVGGALLVRRRKRLKSAGEHSVNNSY